MKQARELDFDDFQEWSALMRMFLLLAIASISLLPAQNVSTSALSGGEGVNGVVNALAVQADGKIIVGGKFSNINGVPRNNLARLNVDGTLDRTFVDTLALGVNGEVNAIAIQPDGAIVVGGLFNQAGEVEAMNLVRYQADGSVDKSLGGSNSGGVGTNGAVLALAVQADGGILVGGSFNTCFGQPRRSLALLKADGTLAEASPFLNGSVRALASASEAPAVAGGVFEVDNQNARNLFQIK